MSNEARRKRATHARETRGKFGGGGENWVVQIPDLKSEDWFKVTSKAKNEIDIVEFRITQDWYPKLKCRGGGTCGDLGLVPGELDYKLEIPVHQRIDATKTKSHLCPMDAFGEPCPVCEEKFALLEKNNNKWDRATMGPLNASWRDFYNVWNYATNRFEPWQVAYTSFEKILQDALDLSGEELYPWAWDDGRTIEFLAREKPLGEGNTWNEPQIPSFFKRDPYPESVVDEVWGFDKYVKISSYDEIAADFYGMDNEVVNEGSSGPVEEPPTTRSRSRGRAAATQEPEQPKTISRGRTTQTQDELPFKSKDNGGSNRCPFGHNWGHDVNNTSDCKNCKDDDFNGCIDENDKIKEQPTIPEVISETTTSRRRPTPEPAPASSRRRK